MIQADIVIAGGTGFLGIHLEHYFKSKGKTVAILTRNPKSAHHIYWDAKCIGDWIKVLNGAEILINLAGKSVNCRYTKENKAEILASRIESTKILGKAINQVKNPPKYWINSSTATIYKDTRGTIPANTELAEVLGDNFSMEVAMAWEAAFNLIETTHTKKVLLRSSIIFGMDGGAFEVIVALAKKGLCSKQGNGQQWISWMHIEDFCRSVDYIIEEGLTGIFNLCVPHPIQNYALYESLKKILDPIVILPQPVWLLKLGAMFMGTETELILKSRKVYPENLLNAGFEFNYPTLDKALVDLIA